jgi:hypothetical protein
MMQYLPAVWIESVKVAGDDLVSTSMSSDQLCVGNVANTQYYRVRYDDKLDS